MKWLGSTAVHVNLYSWESKFYAHSNYKYFALKLLQTVNWTMKHQNNQPYLKWNGGWFKIY